MKQINRIMAGLIFSLNLFAAAPMASKLNYYDMEKVTISLLHPSILTALKKQFGGFPQFQNEKIVKIVPKQLPADAEYDSSFKATGWAYEITIKLETLRGDNKIEHITMILSNEFSNGNYDVKTVRVE